MKTTGKAIAGRSIVAALILFIAAAIIAGVWDAAKTIGESIGKQVSSEKIKELEKKEREAREFGLKYWKEADKHKMEIREILKERDSLKEDLEKLKKKKPPVPTTPELCVEYEKSKAITDPGDTTAKPKTVDEVLAELCSEIAAQLNYIAIQVEEIAKADRVIDAGDATILEYEKESEDLSTSVKQYQIAAAAANEIIKELEKSNFIGKVKAFGWGIVFTAVVYGVTKLFQGKK